MADTVARCRSGCAPRSRAYHEAMLRTAAKLQQDPAPVRYRDQGDRGTVDSLIASMKLNPAFDETYRWSVRGDAGKQVRR